jgi:hypothetical protein
MGIADQFKDKASKLEEQAQAQRAASGEKGEAPKRPARAKDRTKEGPRERTTEEAMQDAEDKFRQNYEI